jgi:FHS family L-fucose permease-like MFS transporter
MKKQAPVFLGFFVMGFVDFVGISTSYAKKDWQLQDTVANLLPLSVFIWFALFSVPTGALMNRIGRRKTVLLGLVITFGAMLVPLVADHFEVMLAAFALVGIGNTVLQVSLNPLLANVVRPERWTSALTGGQLVKAVASFLGPLIAGAASAWLGSWKMSFWLLAGVTLVNLAWLWATPITEEGALAKEVSWTGSLRLLRDPVILQLVLGVVAIVGLDVGLNTTLPKFIMYRCGLPLEKAGFGTSVYFMARTLGSFIGVFALARIPGRRFFGWTVGLGIAALAGALFVTQLWVLLALIFLSGLAVANVFPILFSAALRRAPALQNEVSGLMIMGVAGGAVLLPVMGMISDAQGPVWALGSLLVAWGYLALIFYFEVRPRSEL